MLALADRADRAPAATTSVISQVSDDLSRLISAGRSQSVVPALVEPDTALDVARALAPLRDAELAPAVDTWSRPTAPMSLADAMSAVLAGRTDTSPLVVALGTASTGAPVHLDWAPGAAWSVSGTDVDDIMATALAIVLSVALGSSPERTPMVVIGDERSPVAEVVARLPHFAGWCAADDAETHGRLLARLAHLLGEGGSGVVIVEPFGIGPSPDDRAGLLRRAPRARPRSSRAAHPRRVVDIDGRSRPACARWWRRRHRHDVAIVVDRRGRSLHGTAFSADGLTSESFTPVRTRIHPIRGAVAAAAVRVRPRTLAARTATRAHRTGRTVLRARRADVSVGRHHRPCARRDGGCVAAATRTGTVAGRDPARNTPRHERGRRSSHRPRRRPGARSARRRLVATGPGRIDAVHRHTASGPRRRRLVADRRDRRAVRATRSQRLCGRCVEPAVDRAAEDRPHHGRRAARATRPCCRDHRCRRPRGVRPTGRRRVALGCPVRSGECAAADRRPHPARPAAA